MEPPFWHGDLIDRKVNLSHFTNYLLIFILQNTLTNHSIPSASVFLACLFVCLCATILILKLMNFLEILLSKRKKKLKKNSKCHTLCISYIRKLYIYFLHKTWIHRKIILLYYKVQTILQMQHLKKLQLHKKILSTREKSTCVRRQAYLYLITSILFEQLKAGGFLFAISWSFIYIIVLFHNPSVLDRPCFKKMLFL